MIHEDQVDLHDFGIRTRRFWRVWFLFTLFILCPPVWSRAQPASPVLLGAGDIALCGSEKTEASAKLLDKIKGNVFTAGDNAYGDGKLSEFLKCYDPTWGCHLKVTRPSR